MLTVFKASAGSGKTFRLVTEYLKLVLTDRHAYRHILAVTFTNKATAEMKERILAQLDALATSGVTPYLEVLQRETGLTIPEIRRRADAALSSLLFDFHRFSVSTIDKFTQRVLKAFNREIGINPDYLLETDTSMLVSEAVDRLIAGIEGNKALQTWLEAFIEEKIRNNRSFQVEKDLKSLGLELFRERLQTRMHLLTSFFNEKESDREYLKVMNGIVFGFENQLKSKAASLAGIWTKEGFTTDDFIYKGGGVSGFVTKVARGEIPETIGVRTLKAARSADGWVSASHPNRKEIEALAAEKLQPELAILVEFYEGNSAAYFTAKVILAEWYTAAVMADLYSETAALSREKGILPLAGSNLLLKSVIDGNDTPFIYEKMGTLYRHFMLDEFQDTSEMQWDNFKPLVANSMAGGHDSLVVGDVKQSIYRWRNSNRDILDHQIYTDFHGFPVKTETLDLNYRSCREIVEFNNTFFRLFSERLSAYEKLSEASGEWQGQLEKIYGDVCQLFAGNEGGTGGFASIEALECGEESFEEVSVRRLVEQVRELYDKGFSADEIAILVRKNDQGAAIVKHFLEAAELPENEGYNLRIISGEALLLKTSAAVQFIVSLFRHFTDRNDKLCKAVLLHLYRNCVEPLRTAGDGEPFPKPASMKGWVAGEDVEHEFESLLSPMILRVEEGMETIGIEDMIIRIAAECGLFTMKSDLPFIQTLADCAAGVRKTVTGDISGFLKWWDEKGMDVPVTVNEEADAIRLLTVHKAKGLEFKAVLIPFLSWRMVEGSRKNILWCVPSEPPFNKAPLVPVSYSGKLARTLFAGEYYKELFNILVDNLNLVYVAFTRAVSVLWVNMPRGEERERISTYVTHALEKMAELPGFEVNKGEEGVFFHGSIPGKVSGPKDTEKETSFQWHFNGFSNRLQLRAGSDDFLEVTGHGKSRKNAGKIIHAILSEIKRADDIIPACRKALAIGLLQPEELAGVEEKLKEMVHHPLAETWFSGKFRVYAETDLLARGMTLRPDRMMTSGDSAVVVDYKSGDLKPDSHRRQVERYARTLLKAGFRDVRGYLWYIRENELVEIPVQGVTDSL